MPVFSPVIDMQTAVDAFELHINQTNAVCFAPACPVLVVKVTSKGTDSSSLGAIMGLSRDFPSNCRPRTHWALIDIRKDDPTTSSCYVPGRDAFLYAASNPPLPGLQPDTY